MLIDVECPTCNGEGVLYRQDCGAHGLTRTCSRCLGKGVVDYDLDDMEYCDE